MNVSLTPHFEEMIREHVESGRYNNASEVVREALRLFEREHSDDRLRAELQIGLDQIERGETVPWTPDLMVELMEEARANASAGKPISDAVKP